MSQTTYQPGDEVPEPFRDFIENELFRDIVGEAVQLLSEEVDGDRLSISEWQTALAEAMALIFIGHVLRPAEGNKWEIVGGDRVAIKIDDLESNVRHMFILFIAASLNLTGYKQLASKVKEFLEAEPGMQDLLVKELAEALKNVK